MSGALRTGLATSGPKHHTSIDLAPLSLLKKSQVLGATQEPGRRHGSSGTRSNPKVKPNMCPEISSGGSSRARSDCNTGAGSNDGTDGSSESTKKASNIRSNLRAHAHARAVSDIRAEICTESTAYYASRVSLALAVRTALLRSSRVPPSTPSGWDELEEKAHDATPPIATRGTARRGIAQCLIAGGQGSSQNSAHRAQLTRTLFVIRAWRSSFRREPAKVKCCYQAARCEEPHEERITPIPEEDAALRDAKSNFQAYANHCADQRRSGSPSRQRGERPPNRPRGEATAPVHCDQLGRTCSKLCERLLPSD